ncbi:rhomboid family intramembrane serine protease [Flammeovirga sp. MY04]|uniref:rhomboid family intramembrane serine protease n=1 Tax=Flammeovirga sp. MY04 TaxID=1191459 RepID=UPI0008064192|nr:rhomboid family intramembrane serine protease [Flammeovirga sp. MY04]ANQ49828.1 rhomboid family intramembrane serine protease [Flammeovirga sp. MY04]
MNFQLTPYVKYILIINFIIFGISNLVPLDAIELVEGMPLKPINMVSSFLGYHYPGSEHFEIFQPFTYMFVHNDFRHIFSNMFALFIFGPMLENVLGSKRFLILYIVCGLGGGALYGLTNYYEIHQLEVDAARFINDNSPENLLYFFQHNFEYYLQHNPEYLSFVSEKYPALYMDHAAVVKKAVNEVSYYTLDAVETPMIGASGAIFGLLFTFAYLFPNLRLMLLFPPIPIKAKYLVGAYILFEIYELIQNNPGDNVAHLAHLGGVLFAFILMKRWKYMSYK